MSVVQSLWIGQRLGEMHRLGVRSVLEKGHTFHLFTYDTIEDVPHGVTVCDAREIFPADSVFSYQQGFGKGSYSAFSNLFRYQLLLERGGWWVDTDVVCLKPFDLETEYVFASEHDDEFVIGAATSVIKAPPGAPVLRDCVEVCQSANKQEVKWGELGPDLLNAAVRRHELSRYLVPVTYFNPINWFEFADALRPDFDVSRLADSYGVHLYHQMWKSEGRGPESAGQGSLYAYLKSLYPGADRSRSRQ
jgi:hypothetical protein